MARLSNEGGAISGREPEPVLRVSRAWLDQVISERLGLGQQLVHEILNSEPSLMDELEGSFYTWEEVNSQLLASRFSTSKVADDYSYSSLYQARPDDPTEWSDWLRARLQERMQKLESLRQRLFLYEPMDEVAEVRPPAIGEEAEVRSPAMGGEVFVVHGHDGYLKLQIANFLERITGKRPVILHEQADSGLTVIEKFENHASKAGFAVVLLTADDVGRTKEASALNVRARQNVVFELGFFFGKLGRRRVVALYEEGVELPSDISGVLYKSLAGNWHTELGRELRAAGIKVDLSKLL